jgi:hypothetical protein
LGLGRGEGGARGVRGLVRRGNSAGGHSAVWSLRFSRDCGVGKHRLLGLCRAGGRLRCARVWLLLHWLRGSAIRCEVALTVADWVPGSGEWDAWGLHGERGLSKGAAGGALCLERMFGVGWCVGGICGWDGCRPQLLVLQRKLLRWWPWQLWRMLLLGERFRLRRRLLLLWLPRLPRQCRLHVRLPLPREPPPPPGRPELLLRQLLCLRLAWLWLRGWLWRRGLWLYAPRGLRRVLLWPWLLRMGPLPGCLSPPPRPPMASPLLPLLLWPGERWHHGVAAGGRTPERPALGLGRVAEPVGFAHQFPRPPFAAQQLRLLLWLCLTSLLSLQLLRLGRRWDRGGAARGRASEWPALGLGRVPEPVCLAHQFPWPGFAS